MENLFVPTLLAIDAGLIMVVVFMLISFVGWIRKSLSQMEEANQRQRQREPRVDRGGAPIQNEIDDFLKEILGADAVDQAKQDQQRKRRRQPQPAPRQESSPSPTPRPEPAKPRPKPKPKPRPAEAAKKKPPVMEPLFDSSAQPTSVAEHVKQHMSPQREHLKSDIQSQVGDYMGSGGDTGSSGDATPRNPLTDELLRMLQSPAGARQAILLNEVFNRRTLKR